MALTPREQMIADAVARMIGEIGMLRQAGITLDDMPQDLLEARKFLHRIDERMHAKSKID